ncbi:uncharacterized protein FTOL_02884 [Fusarium torulosum]|uniref:Uncharacterized protein n=1 Tax=Fusarium torulosum TaxID=33205 RepID=A0AAE8SEQ2_9HYPO|nr:uncharacterized protein FTOL_02884 [Fusarium torulosum]
MASDEFYLSEGEDYCFDQFYKSEDEDYCFSSKYEIPPESTCEMCREIGDRPSSRAFLIAHHYATHWSVQAESEELRWRASEAESETVLAKMLRSEREFLLRSSRQFLAQMAPQQRQIHIERLQKIRECNAIRAMSIRRMRGQFIDDGTDNSPVTMMVNMENPVLETSVPIRVVRAEYVRGGRWYLGHAPGTYIFQVKNYQYATDNHTDPLMGTKGIIVESDFRYVGQIPRHPLQHSVRARRMFKFILTLFISALQLRAGSKHKKMYPDLEMLLKEPRIGNIKGFQLVWEHWERMSSEECPKEWFEEGLKEWPDNVTRASFSKQKHMQELAWHLVFLRRNGWAGDELTQSPLWRLMISSTGLQVESMAELWEAGEEKVAKDMLRSGSRKGLFVYEVEPATEDIHHYYQQPPFNDDPLNPRVSYLLAPLCKYPLPAADSRSNAPSGVQQDQRSHESDSTVENRS